MGFLHPGGGLPLALQSRRTIVIAAALSLALLICLWNTFAIDTPYHLTTHALPHPRPPPPHHHHNNHDHDPFGKPPPDGANATLAEDPLCAHQPDLSNLGLVVKTGATESYARLPTQLLTVLRCVPDFQIFSDMAQTVAGFPVHDALDTVLDAAKAGNKDFDLYRAQQACAAAVKACTEGMDRAAAGWSLDKYKNIHMAEKAWRMMPGKDWYMFIDADTYVLWNSLAAWLGRLDPRKEL